MANKRPASGRKSALDEARALVALMSSLSEAGDALTVEAVAGSLGVDEAEAQRLITLVLTASADDGRHLPLVEEGDGVTLAFESGLSGKRLRLTREEALAVAAALERLGVPGGDHLRKKVDAALAAPEPETELVERLVGRVAGDAGSDALLACARANAMGRELQFVYTKPSGMPESRRVLPERLWSGDGGWYLDAWDLEHAGERTFRIDRMSDVVESGPVGKKRPTLAPEPEARGRIVELVFRDAHYLDLLPWHELACEPAGADDAIHAKTAWYGTDWLPRMVCACAGACTTSDPELSAAVRDVAKRALL